MHIAHKSIKFRIPSNENSIGLSAFRPGPHIFPQKCWRVGGGGGGGGLNNFPGHIQKNEVQKMFSVQIPVKLRFKSFFGQIPAQLRVKQFFQTNTSKVKVKNFFLIPLPI
jgi:hypothetical protein